MFTGIVAATGKMKSRVSYDGDLRIRFDVPPVMMEGCKVGDSISVSGVCLTMLEPDATGFSADVSVAFLFGLPVDMHYRIDGVESFSLGVTKQALHQSPDAVCTRSAGFGFS